MRVPQSHVVGEVDRGWYVGMTLLDYERSNISGAVVSRRELERVFDYAHTHEGAAKSRAMQLGGVRAELADRYIESEVGFNFSFRIISMQAAGIIPKPRGLDLEDVPLGAQPTHRAHPLQDVRAVLEPLGPGE